MFGTKLTKTFVTTSKVSYIVAFRAGDNDLHSGGMPTITCPNGTVTELYKQALARASLYGSCVCNVCKVEAPINSTITVSAASEYYRTAGVAFILGET